MQEYLEATQMDLDDLDIYEDLDTFQKEEEKKSSELLELEAKYNDSLKTVEVLQTENADLKKQIKRIGINFQNLLDTAKAEIKRKDKQIEQLRKEKDDICFRRMQPRKKSSDFDVTNHTTTNWYINNTMLPALDCKLASNEHPHIKAMQEYTVAQCDEPSKSKTQTNLERYGVRIANETHKYAQLEERSDRKYESGSKHEKNPRNYSQTYQCHSRRRERSRERERNERASAREHSRSRSRFTEHTRREEREHRNQCSLSTKEKECYSGGKFDDYTRRNSTHEKYGERSRYDGQDPKTRCDKQEYIREKGTEFKNLQKDDNKNECKTHDNLESSKKSQHEKPCTIVDAHKTNNLFRDKFLKTGENEFSKYDVSTRSERNLAEIKATKVLPENILTNEKLVVLESDSGRETNISADHTMRSNGMITPKKAALFDKLFGGTPTNVGTVNITNELGLVKGNISSITTSPSEYIDTIEQVTKSPTNNDKNSTIDEFSSDSNEFDFGEIVDNSTSGIKSIATSSTKETPSNVSTNIASTVILLPDDEDYFEIKKTNVTKKEIDVENIASDKLMINNFPNLGGLHPFQNIRLPNIYEIRSYQRRLREESVAAKNSNRESIAKMKDAELNATKISRSAPDTTTEINIQKQETVDKEPKSTTAAEKYKVGIAQEGFGGVDVNNEKNTRNEMSKSVSNNDDSGVSNITLNANDLEKVHLIADTKREPNNTMLPAAATLEEENNCEFNKDEVIVAMPILKSTSTETVDFESDVSISSSAAKKSMALNKALETITTGNPHCCKTGMQNVKTVAEKANIKHKTKADTNVLKQIEGNGQSAVENGVMETDNTLHKAKSKCEGLPIKSSARIVEVAGNNENNNNCSGKIIPDKNGEVEDHKVSHNNKTCIDTTVINIPEVCRAQTTNHSDLYYDNTKKMAEGNSNNIHTNDSVEDNKPCDLNNCVDMTVVDIPEASGGNTSEHTELCNDKINSTGYNLAVKDVKTKMIDLLKEKNCENGINERQQQKEVFSPELILEQVKNITDEPKSTIERNEMKSKDVTVSKGDSSDNLVKEDDFIHSEKRVINGGNIATAGSSMRKVFLDHQSIDEQKIIYKRNITCDSTLAKPEKRLKCTNTVEENSIDAETERDDTKSGQILMKEKISEDSVSLKLPTPDIARSIQRKLTFEVANKNMSSVDLEKSVKGTSEHHALIEIMKRSEITWKFKIPKISAKRKRDDESEAKNIKMIAVNGNIVGKNSTKVEKAIDEVEEPTNPLSKKFKKNENSMVKCQAREIIQVPDLSAKIERERLLKDETIAEKQRLLDQEKSRSIIKEIDNWARRKVGEPTETIENESLQNLKKECNAAISVGNEKIKLKSKEDQINHDISSKLLEQISDTERNDKYNKEMKLNTESTKTTHHNLDNRAKYKPQHNKHQQVDGQRILSKEKLKDIVIPKNCLSDRKNELEKVVSVTENTKEKTDIPRLFSNNISNSPHKSPLSTMREDKNATKVLKQHKNQLTEEQSACFEESCKPVEQLSLEEHKVEVSERRKSQSSEERTFSKAIPKAHETSTSQKQNSEMDIQQQFQMKKEKSNEERNKKEKQSHSVKGQKEDHHDDRHAAKLMFRESENNSHNMRVQSQANKLKKLSSKETNSASQTTQVEKSGEVQKPRKERENIDSKKRTPEKAGSAKEAAEDDIHEKRAKIDMALDKIENVQNVCEREAHFTGSNKIVTPEHDTITATAESEVTTCTLPKKMKRHRSVTNADANISSDSDVCIDQSQQRKRKRCKMRIEDSDEDETRVNPVTPTRAGGHVNYQQQEDILDILQNDRAIDTISEILASPQTPTSLPANISQDPQYEELDSNMKLIFASPIVSDKTSITTLSVIDKPNSVSCDLIKVLEPIESPQTEVSVNGSSAPTPISVLEPSRIVNESPPLTATAAVQNTDFSVSDTILIDITSNSFHTSSTNLTVDETNQSPMSMNLSLSDSNASTKHISLGSSDYRFEKVSENVVNLFITRKRRGKRKLNANTATATTNTIPTI